MTRAAEQLDADSVDPSTDYQTRLDELMEIVAAYTRVTERMEASHEQLNNEVIRLQKELASANAALQRSKRLAALGEMAAGIAHEIRNPLASIHLYAQMLSDDLAGQPVQRDLSDKIGEAVRGLDAIVNDVLSVSREIRLRLHRGSVSELLELAVESQCSLIAEHGTRVVIDAEVDCRFTYDADAMRRVLVNLIRNAVQAMGEGGAITLGAKAVGDVVQLTVADSGAGIDEQTIDRIFNPFFTTRHSGTGLGLTIVHRIIEAHGGSICVHNDQGAVFTIHLPVGGPSDLDRLTMEGPRHD